MHNTTLGEIMLKRGMRTEARVLATETKWLVSIHVKERTVPISKGLK